MSDKLAQSFNDLEQTALASLDRYQERILLREAQLAASEAAVATLRQALQRIQTECDSVGAVRFTHIIATIATTCNGALAAVPAPAALQEP